MLFRRIFPNRFSDADFALLVNISYYICVENQIFNEKLIVSTDPGIDDIIALALLSKLSPVANHALLPCFGNGPVELIAKNAAEFIKYCAPNWLMAPNSELPENGHIERPFPDYFHGPDGVWNIHIDSNSYSASEVQYCENSNNNNLASYNSGISLGTLSAFSHKHPIFKDRINLSTISIMGGVFNEPGNETDYSETNIAFDPVGADSYFEQPINTTILVPLDVTRKVSWGYEKVEAIKVHDATTWWLKNAMHAWFEKYNHQREDTLCLHDPLAIWLLFNQSDAKWEESGVRVVLDGQERGRTVFDSSRPDCNIAMELKDAKRIEDKIWHTIFS